MTGVLNCPAQTLNMDFLYLRKLLVVLNGNLIHSGERIYQARLKQHDFTFFALKENVLVT